MPVPTDTFWNIRRLNVIFAISAIALLGVTGWSIIQDYNRSWRKPQQQAQVWEAALTTEKIERSLTPEQQKRLDQLDADIATQQQSLESTGADIERIKRDIQKVQSDRSNLEFSLNNLKATVTVMESQLQDAIAAADMATVQRLTAELKAPREKIAADGEQMYRWAQEIARLHKESSDRTAALDALVKDRTGLLEDKQRLEKRRDALQPRRIEARLSQELRRAPLMQFINPPEKVQQVVLSDVLSEMPPMKVPTIDRCMTCHVNINKKDYAAENVITYLEEQTATIRMYNLPATSSGKAVDARATETAPGEVSMPEFWHGWGRLLSPEAMKKSEARIKVIAKAVADKLVDVTYDGQPLDSFTYDLTQTSDRQDQILLAIIETLYRHPADQPSRRGEAEARVAGGADDKKLVAARTAAMKYPEELLAAMEAQLDEKQFESLRDRYRYALVDVVNAARKQNSLSPLDASPVLLAHPRLDLYVDVDSKHSFEIVGCTSCHDGSGQETDFVLTAHVPRAIWVDEKTGQPVLPQQLDTASTPPAVHAFDLSSMLHAIYPIGSIVPDAVSDLRIAAPRADQEHHETVVEAPTSPDQLTKPIPYVDPATGLRSRAVSQMTHWVRKFEPEAPRSFALVYHEWDWPMRSFKYLQANCTRCHTNVYDIREEAPVVNEGRVLFTQMGCVNCHQMDSIPAEQNRKVGTDLRHVTTKLSPEFINTWIWSPKAFRPSTKMPHFFMLENNSSDEELRRTRQETRAITEYLVRTATPQLYRNAMPAGLEGSAEAGKTVFNAIGCLGCHTNLNEVDEKWIATDLNKRLGVKPADAKAMYEKMTYNEKQLYVYENLSDESGPDGRDVPRYNDGTTTKPGTLKPIFVNHGPELSGIGTKLLAGRNETEARAFLFDWLKEPRHYSQYTVMPRLRLSDQQAADVMEYLLAQKRTTKNPDDTWQAGLTPIDTSKLIELTSLFLRSQFSVKVATEKADDLATLKQYAIDAWPNSATDRPAATAAIDAIGDDKDALRMVFLGKKLISHYGCMSCHAINGTEALTSPCANLSDWGQKRIDKLDFAFLDHHKVQGLPPTSNVTLINGLSSDAANLAHTLPDGVWSNPVSSSVEAAWPHVEHNRMSWLAQKLANTRVYDRGKNLLEPQSAEDPGKPYDKLKMPTFYLRDDQIDAIVTFVISNRDPLIAERLIARTNDELSKRIAQGRFLTEKFNCIGCHQVELNTPPIQQNYKNDEIATRAPPSLRGEGNKIQHDWLFGFLKNVAPIRPLPVIHMPSFPLTDDETTAIAAYFSAASMNESRKLFELLDPVEKYVEAREKSAGPTTQPRAANAPGPGDDWHTLPQFALVVEKLTQWALARDQISPVQLNPALQSPENLAKNYRALLFKARFTRELYDAPYPFVAPSIAAKDVSPERFHKGEQLFYEMQCLKCHVLGDPSAAGATKNPTAPNLGLAHQRLQRRWVRHWVQEPPIIQAGTAMPPFLTGLSVFNLHGQPWPRSQGASQIEINRIEAEYGFEVEEQANLLLDFLYAAGETNYTGVQPVATTRPSPTTSPVK